MQTLSSPMQMRLSGVIKRAVEGPGISWKQGMLRRQICVIGLPESVTLLKSTFKPQAISARYYLLVMLDVQLIPEFSGAATDVPIVEWVKSVELVCKLCTMKNVERVLPLRLQGGALAIYRQLSTGQKADAEQIKQALITAYATDAFNAYDLFVT